MKKILEAISRAFYSLRSIIPDTHPGDIEDQMVTLKELIKNPSISNKEAIQVPDGYMLGGKFIKTIDKNTITIQNAREYITITPALLKYGYKSKYNPDADKHHFEIYTEGWKYIEERSNINPGLAIDFLKRYLHRVKNKVK